MKLRDVTRTYGGAVTHVWPPQLLVQIGPMIVQPGEGVLQSVEAVWYPLVADRRARRAKGVGRRRSGTGSATVRGRCREGAQGQAWEGDQGGRWPARLLRHS